MPSLPPIGRDQTRSPENPRGLPERFQRTIEQWRELLRPTPVVRQGTGSPEGVEVASQGTFFLDLAGGPGARLYVKTTGTGSSGWEAI